MDFIDPSYLFSYWLFGWFIIFMTSKHIINYIPSLSWVHNYTNPLYGFYVGLFENLIQIYLIYKYNFKWKIIGLFLLNLLLLKVLPIYLLSKEPIDNYWNLIFMIGLFIIYLLYLVFSGTNIYNIYKETSNSIIQQENKTPFIYFVLWISSNFKKKYNSIV
jgi:hypothetical protein